MRIALVGFPYCGKTTLFSAISGLTGDHLRPGEEVLAAVKIPDPRLDWLEALYKPRKRTEATIEFVDLPAGGESERAGLEDHLPALRQSDALLVVLRAFASDAVPPHLGRVDARADLNLIRQEMLFADLLICSNRVERLEAAVKKPTKDREQLKAELDLLLACRTALENEKPLSTLLDRPETEKLVRSFGFLTQKPMVVVVNVGEAEAARPPPFTEEHGSPTFAACATLEADIMQLEPAERPAFLAEYGLDEPVRDRLIRACFDALGMICFLTAGEEEVRAWPIPKGFTAVEAAGKIHTDLARGFIRAETVAFADLKAAGSMREAKAAGKVRQEPKSYMVQDGDVILIKHSG